MSYRFAKATSWITYHIYFLTLFTDGIPVRFVQVADHSSWSVSITNSTTLKTKAKMRIASL